MRHHRIARGIVRGASLLVPAGRREEWRREWEAELAHEAGRIPPGRLLRRAALSMGDAVAVRRHHVPDAGPSIRRLPVEALAADVRFAVRALRRRPGFTFVALLTFGLGIGVNTTVFAAVDAVLFRPLAFADPGALVAVEVEPGASVSKATLTEVRERTRSFDGLAGWSRWGFTWTGEGPAQLVTGVRSTADLFAVLGVAPRLGRLFSPGDDATGAAPVVVASYGFWQSRLAGDRDAPGRILVLNGVAHTLVGVAAEDFAFPDAGAALFVPLTMDPAETSDWTAGYLRVAGRLGDDVDAPAARTDVRAAMAALRADGGATADFGAQAAVTELRDALVGPARGPLLALLAAVAFVLLVACANLSNLMLVRALGRRDEIAVRRALGASSGRIAGHVVVESLVLSAAGVIVGLVIARAGIEVAAALLPANLPGADVVMLDGRVVGAAVLASMAAGVVCGLVPGLPGAVPARSPGQRGATSSAGTRRLQSGLLMAEAALAVVLLASAGLALGVVRTLLDGPTGLDPAGVGTVIAIPSSERYPDEEARASYWRDALTALRALPGVTAAGAVHLAPFGGSDWNPELVVEDRPVAGGERLPEVGWRVVTPEWFETAGIPLRDGRTFATFDHSEAPGVAMVNETLARRFWPDGSAVGRRIRTFFEGGEWVEIVGVVADTRDVALDREARAQVYRPHTQYVTSSMMLAVRGPAGSEAVMAVGVRGALEALDDDVPLIELRPLADRIEASVGRERLAARLLGLFAGLALFLGAVGIYGVTAYSVGRRTRELGMRSALGARRRDLIRLVLGETARVALAGAAIGVVLASAAGRVAAAWFPQLPPQRPSLLVLAAALLLTVALAAALVPARRAAGVDPGRTLRGD